MADYTQGYEPVDTALVTVTQAGHGFTMPGRGFIPVYKNGANWELARANNADTLHQGFVVTIIDANTFILQFDGTLNATGHGLTDDYYYLSAAAAGAVTATDPTVGGDYSAPVASVIDSSHVHLRTNRPVGGTPTDITEVAQDAVGNILQAPFNYDDTANTIDIADSGIKTVHMAPTVTDHAASGFISITAAANVEQGLASYTLPTVTYATRVLLTFECETYFNNAFTQFESAGTYAWADTSPTGGNYWGGVLAIRAFKVHATGTDGFFDHHFVGWHDFPANTVRNITVGGRRSTVTGTPQKQFKGIRTVEFAQ